MKCSHISRRAQAYPLPQAELRQESAWGRADSEGRGWGGPGDAQEPQSCHGSRLAAVVQETPHLSQLPVSWGIIVPAPHLPAAHSPGLSAFQGIPAGSADPDLSYAWLLVWFV